MVFKKDKVLLDRLLVDCDEDYQLRRNLREVLGKRWRSIILERCVGFSPCVEDGYYEFFLSTRSRGVVILINTADFLKRYLTLAEAEEHLRWAEEYYREAANEQ